MVKRERHGEEVLTDEQDEQDGEGVGRKRAQNTQKGGRGHHNLMGDAFADFRHKGKGKIGRIMAGQNHILVKSAGQAKELCPQMTGPMHADRAKCMEEDFAEATGKELETDGGFLLAAKKHKRRKSFGQEGDWMKNGFHVHRSFGKEGGPQRPTMPCLCDTGSSSDSGHIAISSEAAEV